MNDVIQVWKKAPLADQTNYEEKADTEKEENSTDEKEEPNNSNKIVEEEVESELLKVGDIVDILDTDEGAETAGGWSEGTIAKINRGEGDTVVAGCEGLTYDVKYDDFQGDDNQVELDQLRPRARKILKRSDLKEGMEVLAIYNMQEPNKRGILVKWTMDKMTRKEVICTLYVGVELTPVPDCKLLFPDETRRLEVPVKPADR